MAKKFGEFIIDIDAEALKRGISVVVNSKVEAIQEAVRDLAYATHAAIIATAQKSLNRRRGDYIKGLKFETISPDNYVIYLDGLWANLIEDGRDSEYDMKPALLKSTKTVTQGSRAGLPWVQKGKDGKRYAHVPITQAARANAAKGATDLADLIQKAFAMNKKTGLEQKLTSVFKDASGKAMSGKVAMIPGTTFEEKSTGMIRPLAGLVKYQTVSSTLEGKQRVKAAYIKFRTVSDNSPPGSWISKKMQGLNAFPAAEAEVEKEIENILRIVLG